jgi:glycosyltransferase involved in cell wall biosynthesis
MAMLANHLGAQRTTPVDTSARSGSHPDPGAVFSLADVAIVILAYNAEATIASVLDRIPSAIAENVGAILVSDDKSRDATSPRAIEWGAAHPAVNLTVVHQQQNLGYGGNQKFSYEWAMQRGLRLAVMVHGDGQYAPELVGKMVEPLMAGTADAVFGSRMLTKGGARAGGMPLYKYVGNKVLTTFQNRFAGLRLSEWHSGYRAYRLDRLGLGSLREMSDVFDFDTEIILHLAKQKLRISEIAIPTFYGDEKCHVNGLRYAADVVLDVVRFRARGVFGGRELVNAA